MVEKWTKYMSIDNYFRDDMVKNKRLPEEESLICEGPILNAECEAALKSLKENTGQDIDGLSPGIYKAFCFKIGQLVVNALNAKFENGSLLFLQRKAIISLISKMAVVRKMLL